MNLFLDSLSSPAVLILDENKTIHAQKNIDIALNESSKLIAEVHIFLHENNLTISDIQNIIVTNGPWSFTGVRTVCLIANTVAFRSHIFITPLSYFELFENYPIIKCSSKRDIFIQKSSDSEIEILSNEECIQYLKEKNIFHIYWDFDKYENKDIILSSIPNYEVLLQKITLQKEKQIEALYIKKPNIS
jgi:tRNA A37 threonylcarbamoyladenosine modification protein TsaB